LFARDDASVARPGASEPRPRERTRRAEFDGPHGGHLHEGAERPGDGPLRYVARARGGDRVRHRRAGRRSIRLPDSFLRALRRSVGGLRHRGSYFGTPAEGPESDALAPTHVVRRATVTGGRLRGDLQPLLTPLRLRLPCAA